MFTHDDVVIGKSPPCRLPHQLPDLETFERETLYGAVAVLVLQAFNTLSTDWYGSHGTFGGPLPFSFDCAGRDRAKFWAGPSSSSTFQAFLNMLDDADKLIPYLTIFHDYSGYV